MDQHTDYNNKTDEELVALTFEDIGHFECLVDRYTKPLLRYIRRITNVSDDDAKDILQDTFIKVYKNLNGFDTSLKFSSWIYRITHNQVVSVHRRLKARPEGNLVDIEDTVLDTISSEVDILEDIDRKYLQEYVAKALGTLDERYREVLVLRFFEEKGYREISDILRIPEGTVATHINRAKQQLSKQLHQYHE
jgi:RNA polymerase sigma-70 factor, ECF subfamily